jgi:hypothetical protein
MAKRGEVQWTAVNTVKMREAEISVGKLNKTEYKEGEFRNKTKQKQNEIKQPKYEKSKN